MGLTPLWPALLHMLTSIWIRLTGGIAGNPKGEGATERPGCLFACPPPCCAVSWQLLCAFTKGPVMWVVAFPNSPFQSLWVVTAPSVAKFWMLLHPLTLNPFFISPSWNYSVSALSKFRISCWCPEWYNQYWKSPIYRKLCLVIRPMILSHLITLATL